jgi:hypothetical protein
VRFAYADPPYIGQARKHYRKEAASAGRVAAEVDHRALIEDLMAYDGWALSCSSPTLLRIGVMVFDLGGYGFLDECRIGSWVKPFASFKKGVNPGYCWEPVIFWGGRKLPTGDGTPTLRDYVSANITLKTGVSGAKPEDVCVWLFRFLGMQPDDEFVDLFPGSGAVTRAWDKWRNQLAVA